MNDHNSPNQPTSSVHFTIVLILEIKISLIKIIRAFLTLRAKILKKIFSVFILSFAFYIQFSVFTG